LVSLQKSFAMWYQRFYEEITDFFQPGKVNLLYGPRRVGKTELINKLLKSSEGTLFSGEGDDIIVRKILSSNDKTQILGAFSNYTYIFIDEAQRIPEIGWGLKILADNLPKTVIIASGSSSFKLSTEIGAPLAGRTNTKMLYPLSLLEIKKQFGGMTIYQELQSYLIFGMYPETLTMKNTAEKQNYLSELRNSYLLKDILELDQVRNSDKMLDLLRLLAYQIGNEVSLNELSNTLGIAKQTVERYLDLLEKTYIIKKISGFSRNLRKEITKSSRYYFLDNGIRNAVINNFNLLEIRNDVGMLWENFMVSERLKKQNYNKIYCNNYFWRTYDQKEIDLVEEREGKLFGYEFKWKNNKSKAPKEWLNTYSDSSYEEISQTNFVEFCT